MKMQLLSALVLSLFLILPLRAEDQHGQTGATGHPASSGSTAKDKNINAADVCQMPDGSLQPKSAFKIDEPKKEYFTSYPSTADGGGEGGGSGGGNGGGTKGGGAGLDAPQFAMCKNCHGNTEPALTDLSKAIAEVESGNMPPDASKLSDADKKAILDMKNSI